MRWGTGQEDGAGRRAEAAAGPADTRGMRRMKWLGDKAISWTPLCHDSTATDIQEHLPISSAKPDKHSHAGPPFPPKPTPGEPQIAASTCPLPVPRQMGHARAGREESRSCPGSPSLGVPRNLAQPFPPSDPLHPSSVGSLAAAHPPFLAQGWKRAGSAPPAAEGGNWTPTGNLKVDASFILGSEQGGWEAAFPAEGQACSYRRPQGTQVAAVASRKPPAPACQDQPPRRALPVTSHPQLPLAHAPLGSRVRQLGASLGREAGGDLTRNAFPQLIQPGKMLCLRCKILPGSGEKIRSYRKRTLCGCKTPAAAEEDPFGVGGPLKFVPILFLAHKKMENKTKKKKKLRLLCLLPQSQECPREHVAETGR